ncbi:MAG: hypothetical protein DRR19_01470 [Candidatus Parabeggiatoa sp. nov. 1]|nr:MAG: hypothetical protein DRR19_01470 [Gammaproteobacteria bacterium]
MTLPATILKVKYDLAIWRFGIKHLDKVLRVHLRSLPLKPITPSLLSFFLAKKTDKSELITKRNDFLKGTHL